MQRQEGEEVAHEDQLAGRIVIGFGDVFDQPIHRGEDQNGQIHQQDGKDRSVCGAGWGGHRGKRRSSGAIVRRALKRR